MSVWTQEDNPKSFWLPISPLAVGKYKSQGVQGMSLGQTETRGCCTSVQTVVVREGTPSTPSPASLLHSTSPPADTITRGQGSCCSFKLAKQNQASFCYAPQIKWGWSLHMHLPRVQSWSKRCNYSFLDGKLWLSIILICLTHVSLLWPLRDTEIAYNNTKKSQANICHDDLKLPMA